MLVHLVHFGCRLNAYESISLASGLESTGFSLTTEIKDADFVIINTCTVTNRADQKNRQAIRRAHRENPGAKIVVTGCYATTDATEIKKLPGVYSVVSNFQKAQIPDQIMGDSHRKSSLREGQPDGQFGYSLQNRKRHSRAYIKIQDGCNKSCSYCKIPLARGAGRSRDFQETLEEARELIQAGFREITLTGVNLGWYRSLEGKNFYDLLEGLLSLDGDFYIRISSIEPGDVNERLAELLTHPRSALFLHAPLQSGSKEILKAMRRGYTPSHYQKRIEYVKKRCPDIHLGTDVIIGFPGETDAHFQQTFDFCKQMEFANIHIFPYSPRKNTPIVNQLELAPNERKEVPKTRVKKRIELMEALKREMHAGYVKKTAGQTFRGIALNTKPGSNPKDEPGRKPQDTLNLVTENYIKLSSRLNPELVQKGDLLRVSYDQRMRVQTVSPSQAHPCGVF